MAKRKTAAESVRAPRDGHEYHEIWVARRAMQLLWPDCNLAAIAVEGTAPVDQAKVSKETSDIADMTLYYGDAGFENAKRTTYSQVKYSIAYKNSEFRVADAKKTIKKFSKTYKDHVARFGQDAVDRRLDFELLTNRPVHNAFRKALEALASNSTPNGQASSQAKQFKTASGLKGKALGRFASTFALLDFSGGLRENKQELTGLLVDWSATSDPLANSRLGALKQLVRDKAGSAGAKQNLIRRTDILAAFDIGDPEDLLPCKSAFPDVGRVVERQQLPAAIGLIPSLTKPLLIHAAGGVGKTVFMNSLAIAIQEHNEIVFFDCFGGGAYRSPADVRHLPKKGLIHIANTLAFRGLCDPILPGATDVESLLKTFRRRMAQCVATLRTLTPRRELLLFIDGIDNAEFFATERGERAFPTLILESLHHEPISGLKVIVSCRPERKPKTHVRMQEFALRPFTLSETETYLRPRLTNLSQAELNVAQVRSGGNPRVLEYLVTSGRGLLERSEIGKTLELDDLIQRRIASALTIARDRGYPQEKIDAFLAGLAILPPPVPLEEYAGAQGLTLSEIESFASDLNPLLERTTQGLMFRDEPTETFVRDRYASSNQALQRVADNLLARQDSSIYAARALPTLLQKLGDGKRLFNLAFDMRIPAAIASTVGKRNIRYARIKAATLHAATKRDLDQLIQLLVELSTVAEVDQRGATYILGLPGLVVASRDSDALRRLFETRTAWPGTRHARLAIANALSGESGEAYRHAIAANEWIEHYRRNSAKKVTNDRAQPERVDIAAIPLFLLTEGRHKDAQRTLGGWRPWYAYEVCKWVFEYLNLAVSLRPELAKTALKFAITLSDIGPITAALSFAELRNTEKTVLIAKLSKLCRSRRKFDLAESYRPSPGNQIQDGLRMASAIALSLGLPNDALAISKRAPHSRPRVWSFRESFYSHDVFKFLFREAVLAATKSQKIHERDLLPTEIFPLSLGIREGLTGQAFREKLNEQVSDVALKNRGNAEAEKDPNALSYDEKEQAQRFVSYQLEHVVALTQALSETLMAKSRHVDSKFTNLVSAWERARERKDRYQIDEPNKFFRMLGFEIAFLVVLTRSDLSRGSIDRFLKAVHSQVLDTDKQIEIIGVLARRQAFQTLAGEQAVNARDVIQAENEVSRRASLFAALASAILPASTEEAAAYFRLGLEQMDAIGSGDYVYTNELLIFASSMKGAELDEPEFHTLSNICELNLSDEPHKFYWAAYGQGMSRASGVRGLAKLCRLDDRSKIGLDHTLLPYLIALVDQDKLEPELALTINRLAGPVEYFESGTKEFATALDRKGFTARPNIVAELMQQFEDENPGFTSDSTAKVLAPIAERALGKNSEMALYLSEAEKRFNQIRETRNKHMNYRGNQADPLLKRSGPDRKAANRSALRAAARTADPTRQASLWKALSTLGTLENVYDLKGEFFSDLRAKVTLNDRPQYIGDIAASETLNWYWKLAELKDCRDLWSGSSASLAPVFAGLAIPLVRLHANDLVSDGSFSGYKVREIVELTGVSNVELVLELVKTFAQPDSFVPGAVWLALGSFVLKEANDGQGQIALSRLLKSDAAKLTDGVADGAWKTGLYPGSDARVVVSQLVWRMLGAAPSEDRWRAAHSMRALAKFGCWDILDQVVGKWSSTSAGPFQAGELPFYYLHARLWLFIALDRLARDYPAQVARYKDILLPIALDVDNPHLLMKHFAGRALRICLETGDLKLPALIVRKLAKVDKSPHPRLRRKIRKGGDFYHGRPNTVPKPPFEFHFDYDFRKGDIDNLAHVFGQACWSVADKMSEIVHELDPSVTGMWDEEGRRARQSRGGGSDPGYQTHGQQLGWHALFLAAGQLLRDLPVTDDWWYENDPWGEWLHCYTLTREDGLWLSDGTDRTPLDTVTILLEESKDALALTGKREELLTLVGLTNGVGNEVVIEGNWYSSDLIRVRVSSALVNSKDVDRLAKKLVKEDAMRVWLPSCRDGEGDEPENLGSEMKEYAPWIVSPSCEARLDEYDPFGVSVANERSYIHPHAASALSLKKDDPFGRNWTGRPKKVRLRAHAWGREYRDSERSHSGLRLLGSADLLREALSKEGKSALLLIVLQRYEKEGHRDKSKYTHTVAVVSISKKLAVRYFAGRTNELHVSQW